MEEKHIKNSQEWRHKTKAPQHDKVHLWNTANNVINGEKWKGCPLRSCTKQG